MSTTSDFLTTLRTPSVVATCLGVFTLGIYFGYSFSQPLTTSARKQARANAASKSSWPNSYDVTIHRGSSDEEDEGEEEEESEEDDDDDGEDLGYGGDGQELKDFSEHQDEVKLVLVVRTDLGMQKGKIAAQASHATLACYKYLTTHAATTPYLRTLLRRWNPTASRDRAAGKVEEQLLTMQAQAMSLGLCAKTIRDAGRTQIAAGSLTVLGILGPKGVVDQVTGGLKLL